MEKSIFSFALSTLLFNSIALTPILSSTIDRNALLSFKNSITTFDKNWSENASVCDWIGVSCGHKHRRVTALNFSGYGLAGTVSPHLGNLTFLRYLDISSNQFTGILPSQLSNLHRLKVMNIGVNSFTGDVPMWLGSLDQLEELYLHNNSFSGRIHPFFFNNSKLQVLDMSSNLLVGGIPSEIESLSMLRELYLGVNDFRGIIPEEIGNLSKLEKLNMQGSSLTGNIPSSIFNLSSLKVMNLSNNSLLGSIPTFLNLPELEELHLDQNKLTGWLPSDMCNSMPNIKKVYLSHNQFEGKIPPNIWKCGQLRYLYLSYNNLSGTIPPQIGNMSMLSRLILDHNYFTGELPREIGSLRILEQLDVLNNSLHGSIPSSIFNISTLRTLGLSFNEFSGTLPSDLGHSLFNLEWLLLGRNKLIGPIPNSITNASKLTTLDMSNNFFTGSIPHLGNLRLLQNLYIWRNNLSGADSPNQELAFLSSLTHCRYLKDLEVSNNPLHGIIPSSIGNLSSSLQYIWAFNNDIMGVIPFEIGNLSSLIDIHLAKNQLSGPIPPTIGKLKQLQRLYLQTNQLGGPIPKDLCRMNYLGELILGDNMLVGPIPECLGDVKSLREVHLGSNQLNSTIPPKFWTLTDLVALSLSSNYFNGQLSSQLGKLKAAYTLDLSFNQFSGDIPSSIDGCQSLESLKISNNLLSGSIPRSLGALRGLITLDLSYNNLSGMIPKKLEELHFLENFNVSNNRLEGMIPNGGCFGNFTAQPFPHNLALCGAIRFGVPPCSQFNHGRSGLMKGIVSLVILAIIGVIVMLVFVIRRQKQEKVASFIEISPVMEYWRRISFIDLEQGTSSFSEVNLLGRGSYGSVFEATLSDGLKVAAKVFNLELQGAVRSFDTETEILGSIRHRNLVKVIGCCSNTEFKALILTYMPNGSLDKWLYSSDVYDLDLIQRVKIAIDVAAALEYLHHGYTFPVIHCDVKPSNVLFDGDMVAHLSDFGISKLFDGGEDFIQTQTLATIGYASPELGTEGRVSTNGDVYSFGIMLLEMFTGKRPTDDMFGAEMSLKEWAIEALQQNAATDIVASVILSRGDRHFSAKEQCVSSIFELAMKCLAFSPHERINMIEASATLQKINARIVAATQRRRPQYGFPVSNRDSDF